MLTPADVDLCRRDAAIPGLATVLDPDALISALEPHLRLTEGEISSARSTYVRYKPGANCLVSYRARISGDAGGEEIHFHAKAYGADAPLKLKKARERPGVPGPFGPGRVALRNLGVVVSFFPNDDKLETVRTGASPELLRRTATRLSRFLGRRAPDAPLQAGASLRGPAV